MFDSRSDFLTCLCRFCHPQELQLVLLPILMPFKLLHSLIWLGGLLFGILPFAKQHCFGENQISPYLGQDYFGSHILIALGLAAAGSTLWGGLARWLDAGGQHKYQAKSWLGTTLLVLTLILSLGFSGILTGYNYLFTSLAAALIIAFGSIHYSHHPGPSYRDFRAMLSWLRQPKPWNGLFFIVLYLLLLWHNFHLISGMPELDGWHKFSIYLNRIFTQLALIGVLYFVIQLSIQNGPLWSRWIIWAAASLAPIAIVLDHFIMGFWSQTLIGFLNNMGVEGVLNMQAELKGGGIDMAAATAIAICLSVFFTFCALTFATIRVSNRFKFHSAPIWILLLTVIGVSGSMIEQAIGKNWKSRRNWMQEYSEFELLLSPVRPPKGIAFFDVEFRDHDWSSQTTDLQLKRTPDIYLIFVESLRDDVIGPKASPFLHHLKTHEAQPISRAWASSNGTHLSWYGTFTGQVPLQYEASKEALRAADSWPGLSTFHLLKKAGYSLNVHAASDLAYRDMGKHFFSTDNRLFQRVREDIPGDPIHGQHISERERLLLQDLKIQVDQRPVGGHLDIITIDSPHFYYTWHPDFTPPFTPYYQKKWFPAYPSAEDIQLVKNKYLNGVAWSDHIIEDFCRHLIETDRYDDSIVIVLGDHGEEFQDHGGWLHVSSLENEQIRVPMLIKWPASYGRGPLIEDASQLDLLPSLIDYLSDGLVPDNMAGISTLEDHSRTIISTTAQGGSTREAMVLARGEYKAYFTWPHYWNGKPSTTATLSRFTGPQGDLNLSSEKAYFDAIKQHFPDAIPRFFKSFSLKPELVH